ncbi:MAG: DUF4177 domain-containing protein [Chitinophagaceae bacterium]|nr:DUF4177 domain-containing protein [Chitinophagaceae bacterium]
MKKLVFLLLLMVALKSNAQKDSLRVEQYCELVATPRLLSSKVTIDIDYGDERSVWNDNRLRDENGKLKKFNTVIDALNFLGKDGWKLVNAFPVFSTNAPSVYHYVLKKEFFKTDTEQ